MASMATAPDATQRTTHKMPLRTYSRRSLKRRHTSSPISDTERTIRRINSFSTTTSQPATTIQNTPAKLTADRGRKRSWLPGPAKEDKTPNDLAWEALTSSAPFLTQHVEKAADVPHLAKETEDRQEDTEEAIDDRQDGQDEFDPIVEEQAPQEDASQHEAPEGISLEDSGDGNYSSEPDEDIEGDSTALTSSSEGDKSYFSATPGVQKLGIRAPFLVFDKSPPRGFKVLKKRRASPVYNTSATKRNKLSDGFSAEEARPSPLGRRRWLHHLDSEVGSLELTQKAAASQQTQRSARRNSEKKARSHIKATFSQRRQYFGTSQFEIEPQDPVESFKMKQDEAENEDFAPTTVSIQSSQRSADDDFNLIVIPRTDPPEPTQPQESGAAAQEWNELEANGRADNQLPPKRILRSEFEDSDGLTLRPGSLSWLRGMTQISETLPLSDAARPRSF